MRHEQRQQPDDSIAAFENNLLFIVRVWALSIEVFLHRDFGERYIGGQGIAVLLLIPIYCVFWENYDIRPMLLLLPVYLVMCIIARVRMFLQRLRHRGADLNHSYYSGWPHIMRFFPGKDSSRVKAIIEPLLVISLGLALCVIYRPLGVYLVLGALCMGTKTIRESVAQRVLELDMHDLLLEQQARAERFRASSRNRP